ncbi:MAG: WecB/TagA/CpsF family glycosyltransferase [Pseudomonadota bacterium]
MTDHAQIDATGKSADPKSAVSPTGWPINFMGLQILRRTSDQMVRAIERAVSNQDTLNIAFCNANTLLQAHDDLDYRATLGKMTLLNDGIGAELAARILDGASFPENLNGTDFVPYLFGNATVPLRVYLLGAKPDIVEKAAANWAVRYPQHVFCGHQHGYFDKAGTDQIIRQINAAEPDVLLVAMGNPAQENFIMQHRNQIAGSVTMGVGALFDFTAETVARAPMWMRRSKTEWVFRLMQEPRRLLHRYTIGIARFLWVCVKLRVSGKQY